MKKRILAAALAAVVIFNFCTVRPKAAAGGVVAITAIGILAWQLIGVMTGQYDDTANAIGVFVESGVDGITNSDSPFQRTWRTGWESICNKISSWVDSGTATTKAIEKSIANGFSKEEHFKVAEIICTLYEEATLSQKHPDNKNRGWQVYRLISKIKINHKLAQVKITAFEKEVGKNRIYTIELEKS